MGRELEIEEVPGRKLESIPAQASPQPLAPGTGGRWWDSLWPLCGSAGRASAAGITGAGGSTGWVAPCQLARKSGSSGSNNELLWCVCVGGRGE